MRFLPGQGSTASGEADDGSAQGFQGGPVKQIFEFPEPQMMEQLVDCQRSSSNSQCLLVKLGFLGPERTLVPRERVQQWTVEQIANWSREAWVQAGGKGVCMVRENFQCVDFDSLHLWKVLLNCFDVPS